MVKKQYNIRVAVCRVNKVNNIEYILLPRIIYMKWIFLDFILKLFPIEHMHKVTTTCTIWIGRLVGR